MCCSTVKVITSSALASGAGKVSSVATSMNSSAGSNWRAVAISVGLPFETNDDGGKLGQAPA